MNTMTQAVSASTKTLKRKPRFLFSVNRFSLAMILVILLFSAFSVVYLKDLKCKKEGL